MGCCIGEEAGKTLAAGVESRYGWRRKEYSRESPFDAGFKRISSSLFVHCLFPQNEGLELLYGRAGATHRGEATWGWIKRSPRKTEGAGGTAFLVPGRSG